MSDPRTYHPRRSEWRERTGADIYNDSQFAALKAQQGLYVVGVMGFAGQWKRSGLVDEKLEQFIAEARSALRTELARLQAGHAERLYVATGGTNTGVLALTYDLCAELGITAMTIAPDRALNYELGAVSCVVPFGRYFGDESETFVQLCDEFVLLGGGKQSQAETRAASALGKPITVIQGFGGVADEFTPAQIPGARFV